MARSDRSQIRDVVLFQYSDRSNTVATSGRDGSSGLRNRMVRSWSSWRRACDRLRPSERAVSEASCAKAGGVDCGEPLASRGQQ